ncbi:MAG: DUF1573 domain-containing protein [Prolixibacteraceae bacterium]|nr:DUF1573 domain-containing protein [Prolixibacteraceae bacterium]
MKKSMILLSALFMFSMAFSQDMASVSGATPMNKSGIAFEAVSYDFGAISLNKPVSHKFTLTNNGNAPLIISRVATTCGCTASEYPKEAILPGKSAGIVITYNAASTGAFSKSATVYSNAADETVVLKIKGVVQ